MDTLVNNRPLIVCLMKVIMRILIIVLVFMVLSLLFFNFCYAESGLDSDHEAIVVFPVYAEEILLQMVEPADLIYVGLEYRDNASEYYPTMELTRDIPGRLYMNMDLHDLFILDRKPTLIIVNDSLQTAYENQYGDIPEIVNGQVRTVYVKTPESIKDITDLIQQLGQAVNKENQARQMIEQFNMEYLRIMEAVSKLKNSHPLKAMYYEHFQESFSLLAEICNMESIFDGIEWVSDERYQTASDLNPDIIFYCPVMFDSDGSILYIGQDYSDMSYDYIRKESFLQDTSAIQKDRIYPLFLHQSQYILDDAWYVLSLLKLH